MQYIDTTSLDITKFRGGSHCMMQLSGDVALPIGAAQPSSSHGLQPADEQPPINEGAIGNGRGNWAHI